MADKHSTELQKSDKRELATPSEQTRPGPVFAPTVDIFENDHALVLLADMPGVEPKNLKVDLKDSVLTLSATTDLSERPKEEMLLREYSPGGYYRQFTLSEHIDQAKIEATVHDGVLRLTLPKVEAVRPRQITVKAG